MHDGWLIVNEYKRIQAQGGSCALAVVVGIQGSSYRRQGAKMLISSQGDIFGSISGGCLERDLIRRAQECMASSSTKLFRYDTRLDTDEEDDMVQSLSLGCEGVIEILIEPHCQQIITAMEQTLDSGQLQTLEIRYCDTNGEKIFTDILTPPPQLTIFGAGRDVINLVQICHDLGWVTTVVDCRSSFSVPKRLFDRVDHFVQCDPSQILEKIRPPTLAILMTHNFDHDKVILEKLLPLALHYIGVLGPRSRTQKILDELKIKAPENLHYPIGLDIGGDGPGPIALSILAEVQAVLEKRKGGFLKDRTGPIHESPTRQTTFLSPII
jgi:xanthine dehydrogenase accessory factor